MMFIRVMSSALLLATAFLGQSRAEVFTSTQDLRQVFLVENNLVEALGKYLAKAETRLGRIRRYIQEYEAVRTDLGWRAGDGLPILSPQDRIGSFIVDEGQSPTPADHGGLADTPSDVAGANDVANGGGRGLDEAALERLAGNPLHTFHLMKRLTVYWKHIDAGVLKEEWDGVQRAMYGVGGSPAYPAHILPEDEDLQGAAQALVRLHQVYGLNMTSLAHGNVWGIQSSAELTAQDCLYMGKHAFNLGHYGQSVEWFTEAYSLAGHERNHTVTQAQVAEFLNTALVAHEETQVRNNQQMHWQQQNESGLPVKSPTENGYLPSSIENENHILIEAVTTPVNNGLPRGFRYFPAHDDERNFFALCRGAKVLTPEAESQLHCQYDNRGSPYLTLMPAKVEHHHPGRSGLVTFHDVLSDQEIEFIKQLAKPALSRAMVQGVKGNGNTVSNTRTSKVAWLDDGHSPTIRRLGLRIEALTGLSTDPNREHAEMLQVANYGIGGHYNPHHDYLLVDKTAEELANINPRELVMGDRIATFMFYLSDVTRGGATAFPRLGAAVWPTKGSAAFWYNLKRSGAPDENTLHGACPVLHGSKWVSNKWIRERGQFNMRPCGLDYRD